MQLFRWLPILIVSATLMPIALGDGLPQAGQWNDSAVTGPAAAGPDTLTGPANELHPPEPQPVSPQPVETGFEIIPSGVDPVGRSPIPIFIVSGQVCHNKLLFEEPALERRGQSRLAPIQLTESTVKFFSKSLILPVNLMLGRHRLPHR